MDKAERAAQAQTILGIPLFNVIMDELAAVEVSKAMNAQYNDHEARQASMAALRAIRDLRSRIGALAEGQPSGGKKAPA